MEIETLHIYEQNRKIMKINKIWEFLMFCVIIFLFTCYFIFVYGYSSNLVISL